MSKFVDTAEFKCQKIVEMNEMIKEKLVKAKQFYVEPATLKFEELLQYFLDFADQCGQVLVQLREQEAKEAKEAKMAAIMDFGQMESSDSLFYAVSKNI